MVISVAVVATLDLEKSPEVWRKWRSWINNASWKGSSAWKCCGLPGGQREVIITAFLTQVLSCFRILYHLSLDLYMNTGIVLWENPWGIAASLLPRYGKCCLEELYINMSFNANPSFVGLCKMRRSRWSVEHTTVWQSHILLFHGKTRIFLLQELL